MNPTPLYEPYRDSPHYPRPDQGTTRPRDDRCQEAASACQPTVRSAPRRGPPLHLEDGPDSFSQDFSGGPCCPLALRCQFLPGLQKVGITVASYLQTERQRQRSPGRSCPVGPRSGGLFYWPPFGTWSVLRIYWGQGPH